MRRADQVGRHVVDILPHGRAGTGVPSLHTVTSAPPAASLNAAAVGQGPAASAMASDAQARVRSNSVAPCAIDGKATS